MRIFKKQTRNTEYPTIPISDDELLLEQATSYFENNFTPSLIVNKHGLILAANATMRNYANSSKSQIKAIFPEISGTDIVSNTINTLARVIQDSATSEPYKFESSGIYIQISSSPIVNNESAVIGFVLQWKDETEAKDNRGVIKAIDRSRASIEFSMNGTILGANNNFLSILGYSIDDIIGKNHNIMVPNDPLSLSETKLTWKTLSTGSFVGKELRAVKTDGSEIWLSAIYNPVLDEQGNILKVVMFGTDITSQKLLNNDYVGQIKAIRQAQAHIEFDMQGHILTANDAFLATTGYSLEEIVGKHHRIFVKSELAQSEKYQKLWDDLNSGVSFVDEIERVAKDGTTLWLQASYNPIPDSQGKPFKVVKYAINITQRRVMFSEFESVLTKLSAGNLSVSLNLPANSEFYQLSVVMNQFVQHLKEIITNISDAASSTNNSAEEIAQANSDLSIRTEQQASSLQHTAAIIEKLVETINANSRHANQANNLANDASSVAESGGEMIENVISKMAAITASARKISDIIGVIDGIAFQTNILALNAAVEAARAGEQGRGFAVVASEVRTLAQRSANAAKDIKQLISDSVSQIEDGNKIVINSGETMNQIVSAIEKVNTIIAQIDESSASQTSVVNEVSKTINEMDNMTQQNAAMVEQAAAASESMQSQAASLDQLVSKFHL